MQSTRTHRGDRRSHGIDAIKSRNSLGDGNLVALVGSCSAQAKEDPGPGIQFVDAFPKLSSKLPLWVFERPGDDAGLYLLEQDGRIYRFLRDGTGQDKDLVLDISDRVNRNHSEAGLLSAAFHPNPEDRRLFVSYVGGQGRNFETVVSSFMVGKSGIDPEREMTVLSVPQPWGNHNGGHILFGPDGLLYLGLGDGGSAGDPEGNGQNAESLLGAILRIDVSPEKGYRIPPDNPLVGLAGRDEIFAWGLRNPWRFAFDANTKMIWAGDVGQNRWEEIHRIAPGGNHGWNVWEGEHCYRRQRCKKAGFVAPVAEYGHDLGQSVTGGIVVRNPDSVLDGWYLYADFASGRVWGLKVDEDSPKPVLLGKWRLAIASFAQLSTGEILVMDLRSQGIFRLETVAAVAK